MCPLVYPDPSFCYNDRKCCLSRNEHNCGKWLVLHERCFVASHSLRVTRCRRATDWFVLVLIVVIGVSVIGRIRPLTSLFQFQASSVFLIWEASQALQVHSQREHIFCGESERMSTHDAKWTTFSPQCLHLLLIPFLFCFFKCFLVTNYKVFLHPHTERVEVDRKIDL